MRLPNGVIQCTRERHSTETVNTVVHVTKINMYINDKNHMTLWIQQVNLL
jgi:hypothetical protein